MLSSYSSYGASEYELGLILVSDMILRYNVVLIIYLQAGNYETFDSNSTAGGYVEPSSLAKICAERIASIITLPSTLYPSPKATLVSYIEHVVDEAGCAISVTTTALALLSRYASVLSAFGDTNHYSTRDACALFLAAFMAAARMIHDAQPYTTFWVRVANGEYSSAELALMERQFMEVVEWSDASSSSGSDSWELDLGDVDEVQDASEGMWMMSCESDEFGGAGLIESIPMLDDEDEEMFMQALHTPKPPPLARHVGARQKPIGPGFRRASRMFNES